MTFFGILFGIIVSAIFIVWNNWKTAKEFESELDSQRESRPVDDPNPLFIPVAMIAQDMIPLFSKLPIDKEATIQIVGHDLHYNDGPNGSLWLRAIHDWLATGACVQYVLISEPPFETGTLSVLQDEFPNTFTITLVDLTELHGNSLDLARKYLTCHPTIVRSPKFDALWLEKNHPKNSVFAFNVEFYSPVSLRAVNNQKLFERIVGDVNNITFESQHVAA